jgi:hypothetical protein
VTIAEMVRNGTMSAEVAAVLWAAVDEQVSFLTVAIPRFAGKTTMSNAALALRPPHVPLTWVDGDPRVMDRLKQERRGGYLAVAEFDRVPMPGYIWGEPVRRVFDTVVNGGYSLQSVLHAGSVDEGIRAVTEGNRVSDEHAAVFKLVLYIERFGSGYRDFWRRLTDVYEVDGVQGGRPAGRSLFRWSQTADRFEKVEEPRQWGQDRADLARRAGLMLRLAETGKTDATSLAAAIRDYRETHAGRPS